MKNVGQAIALGVALMVVCGAAPASDRNVDNQAKAALDSPPYLYAESGPADQAGDPVVIGATRPRSNPWADFDRTVAAAATPDCLRREPRPDEPLSGGGLLRLPLLLHSAVTGGCR